MNRFAPIPCGLVAAGSNHPSPQPAARRPLNLAARTTSTNATPSSSNPASPDPNATSPSSTSAPLSAASLSKPNPFGGAKPVDASAREKAAEEKLAKQAAERQERLKKEQEAKQAAKKDREFVRAPVVKGEKPAIQRNSSSKSGAAALDAPAGKEEATKLGEPVTETVPAAASDDFKPVPSANKKTTVTKEEAKVEEKKVGSAYAGLEVEGGDDDEDEEELVEGVKKVEV